MLNRECILFYINPFSCIIFKECECIHCTISVGKRYAELFTAYDNAYEDGKEKDTKLLYFPKIYFCATWLQFIFLIEFLKLFLGMSNHWKEILQNMSKQVKNDNSFGTVKVNFKCWL
jgi:hypothetical protein